MPDVTLTFQRKECVNQMALSEYFDGRYLLSRKNDSILCRAIDEAITKLKPRHKTHIKCYGRDNERRLTGRHETASVSFNRYILINVKSYSFRSINSMQVLLIVVHPFEFLVKLVRKNVVIWKIVVQHQTVIHMPSLISLYERSVLMKKIVKKINHYLRRNQSRNETKQISIYTYIYQ